MSSENAPRRRARTTDQAGIGSRTAIVSAAVAVVVVAGGGWAIASGGSDDKSTGGAGAPVTTPTASATDSPSDSASHDKDKGQDKSKSWSKQCGRAAQVASRAGYGVLAPSELPRGWSLHTCRFSPATGWHVEFSAAGQTVTVDQRKGDVSPVVAAVLGAGSQPGKDVHAPGTGTWKSWSAAGGRNGLSRALSSSGVVLSGNVSVTTLNRLAGVLMTYETAPSGNNGG